MPPLLQTNPYLRDPQQRLAMLVKNALDSSAFEGARGLKPTAAQVRALASTARIKASAKKPAKAS